jgi:glycosyltransferase involved in cell wall biosynthesis
MRICFYAAVRERELFDLVEFYRQDIEILRNLGHEVVLANRPRDVLGAFDLYWVWWQTTGALPLAVAALRRRPRVLVTALSDRDPTLSGMGAKGRLAHLAARTSLTLADLTLATCEDTRLGIVDHARRAVLTAPLGVDTELYSNGGGDGRRRIALTISHLTRDNVARKRLVDVVRVAELVPELDFLIVGAELDGAEVVRNEISRLGVGERVRLLGRVSAEEKRRLLAEAAVYLQPTDYEAFGLAIGEAMASATPVVSNAVGNVPELVGDAGILVPPGGSPAELAAAVRRVLGDESREYGLAARRRIEDLYSLDRRGEIVADALARVTS